MGSSTAEAQDDRELVSLDALTRTDLTDFRNPELAFASRRWAAETTGMFFLMLVVYGSGMIGAVQPDTISTAMVAGAIGLLLLGLVFAFGKVSGAHFNPMVTLAYAMRGALPWRRVPAYWIAQAVGAVLALVLLHLMVGGAYSIAVASSGAGLSNMQIGMWEALLTFGLITILLSVVNGAMNVGQMSAFALSGYFAVVILMFAQYEGVSMNPTRAIVPAVFAGDYSTLIGYVIGPFVGVGFAVLFAFFLRGRGSVNLDRTLKSARGDIESVWPERGSDD